MFIINISADKVGKVLPLFVEWEKKSGDRKSMGLSLSNPLINRE